MTSAETTRTAATGRWRLSGGTRKATLVVHIVSAVGWLGIDLVLLLLAITGLTSDDPLTVAACYQAMGVFVVPLLVPASLVCLASGVLLGIGSKFGLLRYWWVATKLVITLVLSTLILVLLRPSVDDVADLGRRLPEGLPFDELGRLRTDMLFPPVVSIVALTFAAVLSVYKPWGRTPRGRRASDQRTRSS